MQKTSCSHRGHCCSLWAPCLEGIVKNKTNASRLGLFGRVGLWPLPLLPVPPTHRSPLHLQPTMCRQQIYSHQDEAWCGFVIKPLSLRIDWDKDEHEVYITVSVDSLRTPTSRVIWLQLHGWCVGPEREVNKAEKKEGGHMWIAHTVVHTHTHTCAMFSPAVSTFCFSQGLWQRAVEQNSSPPPPIMSTREHTFLRGLEMSRLAEFEVYLRG